MKFNTSVGIAILFLASILGMDANGSEQRYTTRPRPNIMIIVADDMGYSDLGSYRGEIPTPNLDQLAREGVQFTQFHVTPNCAPTGAGRIGA